MSNDNNEQFPNAIGYSRQYPYSFPYYPNPFGYYAPPYYNPLHHHPAHYYPWSATYQPYVPLNLGTSAPIVVPHMPIPHIGTPIIRTR